MGKLFENIAGVEKLHGDRFGRYADLLEQEQLFVSDVKEAWMCLHCGYVVDATVAPANCPVCRHPQGYFIRAELTLSAGNLSANYYKSIKSKKCPGNRGRFFFNK